MGSILAVYFGWQARGGFVACVEGSQRCVFCQSSLVLVLSMPLVVCGGIGTR